MRTIYAEYNLSLIHIFSAWEKEYTALKAQREVEYDTLKDTRAEVAELQKIRRCVDIALRADQPEQTQIRTKRHDIDR